MILSCDNVQLVSKLHSICIFSNVTQFASSEGDCFSGA